VDGQWYLIDATWNAGSVKGRTFTAKYTTDYLFTPPEFFGLNHFPDDDSWQLRDEPISRGEFMRQPLLRPEFFVYGLSLESPRRSQVTVSDSVSVTIKRPANVHILASYEPHGGGKRTDCKVTGKRTVSINCRFAKDGHYDLHFFASKKRYTTYEGVGHIEVNVR
jgi:hypothetical protein